MAVPKIFHNQVSAEYMDALRNCVASSPHVARMLESFEFDTRREFGSDGSASHRMHKVLWVAQTMQENCGFDGQMFWYPRYVANSKMGNYNGLVRGYCIDAALGDGDGDLIHMELFGKDGKTSYEVVPYHASLLRSFCAAQIQIRESFDSIEDAARYVNMLIITNGVFNHD